MPEPSGPPAAIMQKQAALAAQCPPASRMNEAEAAKLPIHVERTGTGPAVVFIHGGVQGGIGGGPDTFAKQADLAARGWQLAMAERPGFGQSPSRGVDDMEADAPWIADLLGEGAHLVGHSWGGAEALLAAARRPGAVRSLVLVEPALHAMALTDPAVQADPAQRSVIGRILEPMLAAQTPRDYAVGFVRSLCGPANEDVGHLRAVEDDPDLAARFGCALLRARMAPPPMLRQAAEAVRQAGIPVLVVSGGWNPTFDAVCQVAARVVGGRHVVVSATNHFPQLENADEFNRAVDAFMREAGKMSRAQPS